MFYGWKRFELENLGQTKAIYTERIPIPAPKVRKGIETRYRNSTWQKYLKSEGWVTA